MRDGVKTTLDAYFEDLQANRVISDWLVVCDLTNNTVTANNVPGSIALGKLRASVKVVYLSIVEQLDVSIEGGQAVQITRVSTTSAV